jgi:SAM-dependent methyltransferase
MQINLTRQRLEIGLFKELWQGGYFEGDPLDPMAPSGYGSLGYMSCLHATYLRCIRPYVTERTRVLEIGPGRGAWTRCFIERNAAEVWALDALSAEHNGFWEYVGRRRGIRYFQVETNDCAMVPDDSIDYFFSFGTFCHLSPQVIGNYMKSVFAKMRPGAIGFLMIADYEKFNSLLESEPKFSIARTFAAKRYLPMRALWRLSCSLMKPHAFSRMAPDKDDSPRPGRWYHLGTANAVRMLRTLGFSIIDSDVGVNHRDPVIQFEKPAPH